MTPPRATVVVDVNVLVGAVAGGAGAFQSWPSPPPLRGSADANAIGVLNDAREFSLFLSEHILANTYRVLVSPDGFGWSEELAEEYVGLLVEIAEASGGGVIDPVVTVSDSDDWEDNRVLECAYAAGAQLLVTNDEDLLRLSPWRGTPIITSEEFVGRVDAMRRARRR